MLLSKFIKVRSNHKNKKYFVSKGYNYTKILNTLLILYIEKSKKYNRYTNSYC